MRPFAPLTALPLLLAAASALGQVRQFPYAAVVQAESVDVRSGPGQRYYATSQLKLGDVVTVHRHDPGGWYMIAPPADSFSWIDASLVKKTGDHAGTVQVPGVEHGQSPRAVVRIGSTLGDDNSVYSRELVTGDPVQIIGERMLATDRGSVLMYQIKPPALEYRWVKGDYIVPASEQARLDHDRDPFAVPAAQMRAEAEKRTAAAADGVRERELIRERPASDAAPGSPRAQLRDIDQRYAGMTAQAPETWRLEEIEQKYQSLLATADRGTAAQIEQRLRGIAARRQTHSEYMEFVRLTTTTTQRESQLLSMQTASPWQGMIAGPHTHPHAARPTPAAGPTLAADPVPTLISGEGAQPPIVPQTDAATLPSAGPTLGPNVLPIPDEELSGSNQAQVKPKLDGAGIVQRTNSPIPGAPGYVLISTDGRLLAFLETTEGRNLEQFVGRPTGVIGSRSFDATLNADRIVVRRAVPVQFSMP